MKKIVLFSGVFLCILSSQAQSKLFIGGQFAFGGSFFDLEEAPYEDPTFVEGFDRSVRAVFELGIPVEYWFSEPVGLATGLYYTEKGGSYKTKNPNVIWVDQFSGEKEDDAYNYLRYRLGYFEIPLLLKIRALKLPDDQFIILSGGASAMFNVASKLRYNTFDDEEEVWEGEKLEGAESLVFGWIARAEWRGGPLFIYGSYAQNLTTVSKEDNGFAEEDPAMSTFYIGMGFLIGQ